MRPPVQLQKLESLMAALGHRVKSAGRIYLTGGATALLHGWRPMTVDVDLKADPEPAGLFEPQLIRYPALDPKSFRSVVDEFCHGPSGTSETAPS